MSTQMQAEEMPASPDQSQEPVGPLAIVALEKSGWEFYKLDEDESWVGENADAGLRTTGGIVFTKDDAARQALDLLRRRSDKFPKSLPPEEWFRKAPIPDDPHGRLVEDLSDSELQSLKGHWPNAAIDKAITLELARRDEVFKAGGQESVGESPKPEAEESDDDWFLNYELPGGRVMSDLSDEELVAIVDDFESDSLPEHAVEAAGSVIAWRKEKELAERLAQTDLPAQLVGAQNDEQRALFDYAKLDADTAEFTRQRATEIKYLLKRTVEDIIEVGHKLMDVKARIPGHFTDWCRAEFEMSERTARSWMGIAREFNPAEVATMPIKVLAQLYPAPDSVKEEIIERHRAGEKITTKTVTTVTHEHQQIEESRSPRLPGTETATVAADISGLEEIEEDEVELVATGRTTADLVTLLKATPSGLYIEDIVKLNFTSAQVDVARSDRLIEKRDLKYFYRWKNEDVVAAVRKHGSMTFLQLEELGCTRYAIESAVMDGDIEKTTRGEFVLPGVATSAKPAGAEKPAATSAAQAVAAPDIEALLKKRDLVVNISYTPYLPGKLSLGVRVGDDPTKLAITSLDFAFLRKLPSEVLQAITEQIERADKESKAVKKPEPKKVTVMKKFVPAKKSPASGTKKSVGETKSPINAKTGAKNATKPFSNAKAKPANATKSAAKKATTKTKK